MNIRKFLKEKRIIIISSLMVFLLVIIITPILFNFFLMSWRSNGTFGDSSNWLDWWGMMVSSIVGGVISGGLTLTGVIITIKHKERNEFLKEYSENKTKLDEIIMEVAGAKRVVKANSNYLEVNKLIQYLNRKIPRFPTLMRIASDINYELYSEIRFNYVMNLEVLYNQLTSVKISDSTDVEKLQEKLQLNEIYINLKELVQILLDEQQKLSKKYNELK